ncbi:hypothetical protein LTS08_001553 [Lithohypha guttulata]|uniref:uncharacterized protein n=1 Tax=Lithohypha guttulata TaxID=1690604 RepID=UPI002DDDE67E|nr:hypothetical protein LTR51_003779 [Lithohypha guttulata]KAK5105278.1 hypothetical protein LTS08_001553 [Lithohypha guttulata]
MRTVDKDDCLMVRGANPRTGLITPDAVSIVGSLDSGTGRVKHDKGPSAQWKMEGDQWVSIVQAGKMDKSSRPQTAMGASGNDNTRPPIAGRQRACRRQFSPLTEENLETLSTIQESSSSGTQTALPPTNMAPNVSKIRRKPVGSPRQLDHNLSAHSHARNPSDQTVVRSPISEKKAQFSYFSPDDIGREFASRKGHRTNVMENEDDSFLGVPVRSQCPRPLRPRGFTNTKVHLEQLQRSLRTSSGPFPSQPSRMHPTSYHGTTQPLRPNRPPMSRTPFGGVYLEEGNLHPLRAARALLPDVAVGPGRMRFYAQGRDYQNGQTIQKSSSSSALDQQPITSYHHRRAGTNSHFPIHEFDTHLRNAGNHFPMSREQVEKMSPHSIARTRNGTLSKQTIQDTKFRESGHTNRKESNANAKDTRIDSSVRRPVSQNPPKMECHGEDTRQISKAKVGSTIMESANPSSQTGIRENLSESEDGSAESAREDASTPATSISGSTKATTTKNAALQLTRTSQVPSRAQDGIDLRDHSICCPECCVVLDCHEGCLGHPSPSGSAAESETSSLKSMGVFDANFETSVKAVNKALLESRETRDSRLAKLRNAIVENFWHEPNAQQRTPDKQEPLKRTLRESPPHQKEATKQEKVNRPTTVPGPRSFDRRQAKAAAAVAVKAEVHDKKSTKPQSPIPRGLRKNHSVRKTKEESIVVKLDATEPLDVQDIAEDEKDDPVPTYIDEPALSSVGAENTATPTRESDTISVLSRVNSLIRYNSFRISRSDMSAHLLHYLLMATIYVKEMLVVVLDTITTLSSVMYEYKRTGTIVLPQSTNLSELAGNCLRSILYLMIAACVYALVARIARVVLVLLRIVALPLKLCVWVIG